MRRFLARVGKLTDDQTFLEVIGRLEVWVAKVLSLAMVIVVLVVVFDLGVFLAREIFVNTTEFLINRLVETFGLFLSVLIALEILENITAYMKRHSIQVELVISTSLTAVARKIIILDLEKVTGLDLIGLAIALFALSISYWIVRSLNKERES